MHKDDLPIRLTAVEIFQSYGKEYKDIYGQDADFTSDKYREFVTTIQLIHLNSSLNSFNYDWRKDKDLLTDEEKHNAKKIKEYKNQL